MKLWIFIALVVAAPIVGAWLLCVLAAKGDAR